MTVPSVRQVFGPARNLSDDTWWPTDQVGKPLTPTTAAWLRKGALGRMPGMVQKALARRGLLNPVNWNDTSASRWTPAGERARQLLGHAPHNRPDRVTCWECCQGVDPALMAWGETDRVQYRCVTCAMKEEA